MMNAVKQWFESLLWNSRFVVVIAVVASIAASFTAFYIATVDVIYIVKHIVPYAVSDEARAQIRTDTVTHIVDVVDGYLLALVMLIFGLGMYELFVSDLSQARASKASSKILVIDSLDDLKNRLAKVILMILIVRLFEHAFRMQVQTMLDLLYFAAAVALVGLALFLTHKSEEQAAEAAPGRAAAGGETKP